MKYRLTRREFLKSIGYLTLSLPILSFIIPHWIKASKKPHIKPHEASFYKRLAG